MATSTTKLGLIKPDYTDVVDVADLNTNADDIDAAVGFTICTNATRPGTPYTGQSIFETDTGDSFIWDGSAWQPGGGGGSIEISATAPSSPAAGDLWWDSDNGNLYIYYDDGDSQQWVAANGPQVFVGAAAPAGYQGQLWFDSTTGKVYIYYDDGTSAQWVSAIGGSLAGSILQVVQTAKTDTFTASVAQGAFTEITGLNATITPSSANSKILIIADVMGGADNNLDRQQSYRFLRGGTAIGVGASSGNRQGISFQNSSNNTQTQRSLPSAGGSFLDSPATTSSITYSIGVGHESTTANVYVNRSELDDNFVYTYRGISTITLMEVAG